jgi:anti-sigma factor RsiW
MVCDKTNLIHRFHDGELSPAQQETVQTHLRDCAECRELLADLRRLSSLICESPAAEMPDGMVERLQQCRLAAADQGILRLAGWMTAVAAGVLIGALLIRNAGRPETASRPAFWETVAVMSPAEVQDDVNSDLLVMAQWMADDLSSGKQW